MVPKSRHKENDILTAPKKKNQKIGMISKFIQKFQIKLYLQHG